MVQASAPRMIARRVSSALLIPHITEIARADDDATRPQAKCVTDLIPGAECVYRWPGRNWPKTVLRDDFAILRADNSLILWRSLRDSNPCYSLERAVS